MKTPLLTVAVTALAGGLLLTPAMQESAQAQVYGGHGAVGTKSSDVILVGKGGGGGGGRGGGGGGGGMRAGGGGGFKGGLSGGGLRGGGGGLRAGGGSFKGSLGRPGGNFKGAYRGSVKGYGGPRRSFAAGPRSSMKGLKGRNLASKHWNNGKWHGGKWKGKHGHKHRRYYGGYGWYGPVGLYAYDYGYGDCGWLRDRAVLSGSSYWWRRYQQCVAYY